LTDIVEDGPAAGAPIDRTLLFLGDLELRLTTPSTTTPDELVHNACRELEALLLEQVSDRLRAELPALVRGSWTSTSTAPAASTEGPMDKGYSPRDIESRLYATWEAAGWFAPAGSGAPYCIMIPPPNVTGTLHMGHAFQHTLMDALTRSTAWKAIAPCGSPAPTTPASRPRWWSSGS